MKRHAFLIAIVWIATGQLLAQPRSRQELTELAHRYFCSQPTQKTASLLSFEAESQAVLTDSSSHILSGTENESFYIYTQEGKGTLIVSADQRMPDVLGYSDQHFHSKEILPEGLRMLLVSYQEAAEGLDRGAEYETKGFSSVSPVLPERIKPLLDTISWGQGYPFNGQCPQRNGSTTVTGCVATALAAVMAYYQYPLQGKGSVRYAWNNTTLQSDLSSHAYDWDQIRGTYAYVRHADNSVTRFFTAAEAEATARLCYDTGLSLQSSFGVEQTGTQALPSIFIRSLVNHFSYDTNIQGFYQRFFSRTDWLSLLKQEIAAGRPVVYTGFSDSEGHTFLADGYDSDDRIHFDFGWYGMSNGYYHVMGIQPGQAGIGASAQSNFNYNAFILTGIQPETSRSSYSSHLTLLDPLSISSRSFSRSERFSVGASFVNQGTAFKGNCAVLLVDEDGESYKISTNQKISLNTSSSVQTNWECQIPDSLQSGLYTLYILAKDDQEEDWSLVRFMTSVSGYYNVGIEDGKITAAPGASEVTLSEGNITPTHALYRGLKGDFTLTLTNRENHFLGYIGVKAVNGSLSKLLARCMISQEVGETCSYTLSGTMDVAAGDYQLIPVYYHSKTQSWKELVGITKDLVTVQDAPSGAQNVVCSDSQLPGSTFKVGLQGVLEGSITLINSGGAPYDQGLTLGFFLDGYPNTYSVSMASAPFFIDTDSTAIWDFRFSHNLPEGSYTAYLYKYIEGNPVRVNPSIQTRFSFEVVKDSLLSGINPTTENEFLLTAHLHGEEVIVQSPRSIQRVFVFNTTAQCVLQQEVENETVSLPAQHFERGIYILRALLSNGKWASLKMLIP